MKHNHICLGALLVIFVSVSATSTADAQVTSSSNRTIASIPVPTGATRVTVNRGSFGTWLRALPLRPRATPVLLFNGQRKRNQRAHYAVVDIDLVGRDLQQCADAVIRLRAEHLWAKGRADAVHFRLTNGMDVGWKRWSAGWRVKVMGGRHTKWVRGPQTKSKRGFRRYLKFVMTYAGTASLRRQLRKTPLARAQIGDVLVQGGFPGHAVIILDMATLASGERVVLLGQSFMPAQNFHVLVNPREDDIGPWYRLDKLKRGLKTPQWRAFYRGDLRGW